VSACTSSNHGYDSHGSYGHDGNGGNGHDNKRAVVQANLGPPQTPCYLATTFSTCMPGCTQPPTGNDTLLQCPCIWSPPDAPPINGRVNQTAVCPPGQVCCWDQPCSKYTLDNNATTCNLGGGGDGTSGSNCVFVGGACQCAAGLTPSPFESNPLGVNDVNTPAVAPYDCGCQQPGAIAIGGTCISAPAPAPTPLVIGGDGNPSPTPPPAAARVRIEFGLALGLLINRLALLSYQTSCKPCTISVSGGAWKEWFGACNNISLSLFSTFVPAVRQNGRSGCSFTVRSGNCPGAFSSARSAISNGDLVSVELSDVGDTSAASSSVVACVAILIACLAALV